MTATTDYTQDELDSAFQRMNKAAIELTDADIATLHAFDSAQPSWRPSTYAKRAAELREAAIKEWAREQAEKAAAAERAAAAARPKTRGWTKDEFNRWFDALFKYFSTSTEDSENEEAIDQALALANKAGMTRELAMVIPLVKWMQAASENNRERQKCIDALEIRVAELEAKPKGLDYLGVWQRAAVYSKNQGVTWDGSVWVCLRDGIQSQPNLDLKNWQLAVRHGQDKS
jgi:hypothetical protein